MRKAIRFGASLAIVAGVIAVYHTVLPVNSTTVALTLLLAILGISAWWGLAEATVASVVAALGFNYFVLPPVGTLTIQDPQNWVALFAFLVTAVTASQLSERARRREAEAEARRLEIERLYALVQAMMLEGSARKTVREFVHAVVRVFGCDGAAVYYRPTGEFFRSGPESSPVTDHELLAASEMEDVSVDAVRGVALGAGPARHAAHGKHGADRAGAIGADGAGDGQPGGAHHRESARPGRCQPGGSGPPGRNAQIGADRFAGARYQDAAHLHQSGGDQPAGKRGGRTERELLTIINEEADRLNELSAEVVEMARIEAGKLHLEKQPVAVFDLISGALCGFRRGAQGAAGDGAGAGRSARGRGGPGVRHAGG